MRSSRRLVLFCVLALSASAGACDLIFDPACTLELRWDISPSSRTLVVGESLTPRGTIATCGGRDREPAQLLLYVPDSAVVVPSADLRSLTAVGVGAVTVQVADAHHGYLGPMFITVVAR